MQQKLDRHKPAQPADPHPRGGRDMLLACSKAGHPAGWTGRPTNDRSPMLESKRVLALIPARGGSKGIPRKNIQDLGGHPLIWHSIQAALGSAYADDCFAFADDEEIAEVARARCLGSVPTAGGARAGRLEDRRLHGRGPGTPRRDGEALRYRRTSAGHKPVSHGSRPRSRTRALRGVRRARPGPNRRGGRLAHPHAHDGRRRHALAPAGPGQHGAPPGHAHVPHGQRGHLHQPRRGDSSRYEPQRQPGRLGARPLAGARHRRAGRPRGGPEDHRPALGTQRLTCGAGRGRALGTLAAPAGRPRSARCSRRS